MNVVGPWKFYSFHIGILMVVEKRAVIDDQTRVRLVVAKNIIAKDLASRKVFRQKQCLPCCWHQLILFESASCKNSETSCLGSRRKFQRKIHRDYIQLHELIVQILMYS